MFLEFLAGFGLGIVSPAGNFSYYYSFSNLLY